MSKAIEFLTDLAVKLQTQDNAYTASPNYCIQEHRQTTGIDTDYTDQIGWFDREDDYMQADEKKAKALDRYYDRYDKEPDSWLRSGYLWQWQNTGISFLTYEAAKNYVAKHSHNHENEIRVYVDSHYRNHEMREVRRLLAGPVQECIAALEVAKGTIQHYQYGGSTYAEQAHGAMVAIDTALAALDTATEPQR